METSGYLWLTIDLDYQNCGYPDRLKPLVDLCSIKLVSDCSLLPDLTTLPKIIHSKLFHTAVDHNRILSISKLMKFWPYEELVLPVYAYPMEWISFIENGPFKNCVKLCEVHKLSQTMLLTFLYIIKEDCESTNLNTLDLSLIPLHIDTFLLHLKEIGKCKKKTKQYTLKLALTIQSEAEKIFTLAEIAESYGIHLILIGLEFHNSRIYEETALRILDLVDPVNLLYLSLSFVKIDPTLNTFLEKIRIFKNLKYLKFTYCTDLFKESTLNILSITLSELPQLSRLIINGGNLHNRTGTLFKKYCKKHKVKKPKLDGESCCMIHNGKLEYLDLSSSSLSDEDISFIRCLSEKNSLKYLDLGENNFNNFQSMNILTSLKESLIILNLNFAFSRKIIYDVEAFPFSQFTHLKYLNLDHVIVDESSKHEFDKEKSKAPNLLIYRKQEYQ